MQDNNLKDQNAAKLNRRKFLTRAGAGLVVASLPAKSVWASSNGLAGSIMASGHASDFASGQKLRLKSSGFWGNNGTGSHTNTSLDLSGFFVDIFGEKALDLKVNRSGFVTYKKGNKTYTGKHIELVTLRDAADVSGPYQGANKQNRFITAIYMSAKIYAENEFNTHNIYFPIVGVGRPFLNLTALAKYLYSNASGFNGVAFTSELEQLITKNPA